MRQGIGLRGLAQEDPLNAFKKEAFALYEEMQGLIRHQVATTIFRVSIVRQPAPPVGVEGTAAPNASDGSPAGNPVPQGGGAGPGKTSQGADPERREIAFLRHAVKEYHRFRAFTGNGQRGDDGHAEQAGAFGRGG